MSPPPSDQDNRPRGADAAWAHTPTTAPAARMDAVLAAAWVAPSIARDRVRRWLTAHRWSSTHLEDLVLAVSEAVSNSVEHGYGLAIGDSSRFGLTASSGTVEVHGRLITSPDGTRRVEFTIRDHGRWIPPALSCGSRGHGMTIMRACTAELIVDHSTDGTTVLLRSRSLPRLPLRLV